VKNVRVNTDEKDRNDPDKAHFPWTNEACCEEMLKVNKLIMEGANTFLKKEYLYLSIFVIVFALIILFAVDQPWGDIKCPYTMIAFLIGAFTSMLAGFVGMKIATFTNVRVTYLCGESQDKGFMAAFNGGQVLGFCLVGVALFVLEIIIISFKPSVMGFIGDTATPQVIKHQVRRLFEFVSGYGLGGSMVALFGRVGGGIYTKAADVGADLAGKVGEHLDEDSPLNPGTIADNVGDNVGDIAGMGADLFGSLAESICAALVVSSSSWNLISTPDAIYFPLVIVCAGIVASFLSQWFTYIPMSVENKLRTQLIVSSVLMTLMIVPCIYMLPIEGLQLEFDPNQAIYPADRW